MTWVRIDASIWTHPKILAAGPLASWLYLSALCWSSLNRTDGSIPRRVLPILSSDRNRRRLAERLVSVGLWEPCEDGWRIHDFKDWQRTRDENPSSSRETSPNGPPDLEHLRARAPHAGARAGASAHGRVQNRTEEKRDTPPTPPQGGRRREQEEFEERLAFYALEHFPDMPKGDALRAILQAIKYGNAKTLEQVKAFIAEHWEGAP